MDENKWMRRKTRQRRGIGGKDRELRRRKNKRKGSKAKRHKNYAYMKIKCK